MGEPGPIKRAWRTFSAIKSVVVGLLILLLWVRSHFVADAFRKGSATQYIVLSSASGAMIVSLGHDGRPTRFEGSWERVRTEEPRQMLREAGMDKTVANAVGFGFGKHVLGHPPRGVVVNIMLPHWLVFALAMPAAVLWVVRRANRPATGPMAWCPACWRQWPADVQKCPKCAGPVGVVDAGHAVAPRVDC